MDANVSKAASVLGKLGGKKTKSFGSSYYSDLGKKSALKRWGNHVKGVKNVEKVNQDEVVQVSTTS